MMLKRKLLLSSMMMASSLLLIGSLFALVENGAATAVAAPSATATPAAQAASKEPVTTTKEITATSVLTDEVAPNTTDTEDAEDEIERPAGWSEETHSNNVDPDNAVVFPIDQVNQMTITISPENWAAMQADMTELYGEQGTGRGMGGPGMGGRPPADMPQPPAEGEDQADNAQPPADGETQAEMPQPPAGGQRPPGGMGGGGMGGGEFTTENPIWVTSTVEFNGTAWTNVGIRYKGNSSLMSSWNSGTLKLPFKLDFDEFEDTHPEIDNQRFFGFQQLSFANNFSDDAMMRDALAYDIYTEAGLVAANTGFYEVFLDYGEGVTRLGMYTAVEVIDDSVVKAAFGDDDGNLYEGDGRNVSLAEGTTAAQIEESYQKENNEDEADWSDIQALYDVLHSETRTEDPESWREELEAVFDVDTFLKWLAVSAQIGHWDTYGAMSHNFYLYNNPATGQLTWITWDHNMTFSGGMGGGMGGGMPQPAANAGGSDSADADDQADDDATQVPPAADDRANRGGPGSGRSVTLDKANVAEQWPLIRFLLDDPIYYARYVDYMAETSELVTTERMTERVEAYAELLAPYADKESDTSYEDAVQRIIDYATARAEEVQTFLDAQ